MFPSSSSHGLLVSLADNGGRDCDVFLDKHGMDCMPNIGELAPDFTLPNQDGTLIRLSDLRGKPVVIFAFPAAGTAGCTKQACSFRDAFPEISSAAGTVLGISGDSVEALKTWKEKQKLPYDLLSDADHKVLEAYGSWGMKLLGLIRMQMAVRSYWVLDAEGCVVDMEIDTGVTSSVEKALKALQALAQV
jgi:peroxiredoxin Q/BCP